MNRKVGVSIVLLLLLMLLSCMLVKDALAKTVKKTAKEILEVLGGDVSDVEIKYEIKVTVRTLPDDEPVEDAKITAKVMIPKLPKQTGYTVVRNKKENGKVISLVTKTGFTDGDGEWEDEGETTIIPTGGTLTGFSQVGAVKSLMNKEKWLLKLTLENCPEECEPIPPPEVIVPKSIEFDDELILVKYVVNLFCNCKKKSTQTGAVLQYDSSTHVNVTYFNPGETSTHDRDLTSYGTLQTDFGLPCQHCFAPVANISAPSTPPSSVVITPPGPPPPPVPDKDLTTIPMAGISTTGEDEGDPSSSVVITTPPGPPPPPVPDKDLTTLPVTGISTTDQEEEEQQTTSGQPTTGTPEQQSPPAVAPPQIIKSGVTSTVTGEQILTARFGFFPPPPPVPGTSTTDGGEKIDDGYNEDPMQGTGPTTFTVSSQGRGGAMEGPPIEVNIEYVPFESYVVKINMDKSKENWDDPESYFGPIINSMVVRKWIVDDNMYVVVNIPIVEE